MVKKRTVRKSKKKTNNNSAYFEYKSGNSRKFWRIVKNGNKITTHYGKFGTLGQMTTKDYGIKVDSEYDKLIQSKKKKGYVEKHDFGDKNPKPPSSIKREYMKICNKAEKDIKLNPLRRNFDCEGILDQDDSEIKWMTGWHKDALRNKEFDFDKLNEHDKTRRKKKKTQKGGGKKWSPKPGYELSPEMLKCLRKPWKGSVPKKNTKNKKYECPMFVDRTKPFVLSGTNKAPKIQLDHYDACYEAMYKDCEKKTKGR
jgi:predicted DNA-binding WGR domain protein